MQGASIYSCAVSGNDDKCPFCNSDRDNKTNDEKVDVLKDTLVMAVPHKRNSNLHILLAYSGKEFFCFVFFFQVQLL